MPAGTSPDYPDWYRIHMPVFLRGLPSDQYDSQKLVGGYVIRQITGDDINVFVIYDLLGFTPEFGRNAGRRIIDRVSWEISVPETPAAVRSILESNLRILENTDWSSEAEFVNGYNRFTAYSQEILNLKNADPNLQEISAYWFEHEKGLMIRYHNAVDELKGETINPPER